MMSVEAAEPNFVAHFPSSGSGGDSGPGPEHFLFPVV